MSAVCRQKKTTTTTKLKLSVCSNPDVSATPIRVADTADAVVLPDLPEEIALALTESLARRERGCWR